MAMVMYDLYLCDGCCEFKRSHEMKDGVVCQSCYEAAKEALAVLKRAGCDWLTVVAKDRLPPP